MGARAFFACRERLPTLKTLFLALNPYTPIPQTPTLAWIVARERFREGRVLVFGSAASTLSVPESDIDLTLHLPSRARLVQELKVSTNLRRTCIPVLSSGASSDQINLPCIL